MATAGLVTHVCEETMVPEGLLYRRGGGDQPRLNPRRSIALSGVKVHIACGVTDMRKGIDGLATLVQENPASCGSLPVLKRAFPERLQNFPAPLAKFPVYFVGNFPHNPRRTRQKMPKPCAGKARKLRKFPVFPDFGAP